MLRNATLGAFITTRVHDMLPRTQIEIQWLMC